MFHFTNNCSGINRQSSCLSRRQLRDHVLGAPHGLLWRLQLLYFLIILLGALLLLLFGNWIIEASRFVLLGKFQGYKLSSLILQLTCLCLCNNAPGVHFQLLIVLQLLLQLFLFQCFCALFGFLYLLPGARSISSRLFDLLLCLFDGFY